MTDRMNIVTRYIKSEKQVLFLENDMKNLKIVSDRLTRNLINYISEPEVGLIDLGLKEILFNAVEHGNLGINFQQKSEALSNNTYFELLEEKISQNKNKRVKVIYTLTPEGVKYIIEDEGNGFNWKEFQEKLKLEENIQGLNGRGMQMSINIFDLVQYNEKGNIVTLIKRFRV